VLHVLDKIQLILRQECVALHDLLEGNIYKFIGDSSK
jgi:hypothetical protein